MKYVEACRDGKVAQAIRAEAMGRMKLNFYGFDPSDHVARYNFVYKTPHFWMPRHLAVHRLGRRRQNALSASGIGAQTP